MAFNPLMVLWLDKLARRGVFGGGRTVIEMGPQTVLPFCHGVIRETVAKRGGSSDDIMRRMFPLGDTTPAGDAQKALYALFGLDDYYAIDYFDPQATYAYDLNYPINTAHGYAVVTNMGTAEHCFNVAACFETAHNLLSPGGVALHVLPAMGDIDHGFYNINPMLYGRLAHANNYQVVDIRYVDHIFLRSLQVEAEPAAGFDFDSLPISVNDMLDRRVFARKTALQFVQNMVSEATEALVFPRAGDVPSVVFDYCFVALRKTGDAAFVRPMQEVEADRNWAPETLREMAAAGDAAAQATPRYA